MKTHQWCLGGWGWGEYATIWSSLGKFIFLWGWNSSVYRVWWPLLICAWDRISQNSLLSIEHRRKTGKVRCKYYTKVKLPSFDNAQRLHEGYIRYYHSWGCWRKSTWELSVRFWQLFVSFLKKKHKKQKTKQPNKPKRNIHCIQGYHCSFRSSRKGVCVWGFFFAGVPPLFNFYFLLLACFEKSTVVENTIDMC